MQHEGSGPNPDGPGDLAPSFFKGESWKKNSASRSFSSSLSLASLIQARASNLSPSVSPVHSATSW